MLEGDVDEQVAHNDEEQEEEFDFAGNAILTRHAASGGDGTDDGSRTGTNSLGHDGVQVLDLQMSAGSSSAECLRRKGKGATVGSRPRSCGTRQLLPA